MIKDEIINNIYQTVILNDSNKNSKGLYDGLIGIALFLYWNYNFTNKPEIKTRADEIIEKCWNQSLLEISPSFYSGQAGIIWSLEWLRNKEMIEFEVTDNLLNKIDTLIIRQRIYTPIQIDLESNLLSTGKYLFTRYKSYNLNNNKKSTDNTILYELYLKEHILYLTDECEKILNKKAYMQSTLLKDMPAQLLISILDFAQLIHKEKIFPSKSEELIRLSCKLFKEKRTKNIVDKITLYHLLKKKTEINNVSIDPDTNLNNLFSILSKAGFYSLLYNDPGIFDDIFMKYIKYKKGLCQLLIKNIKNNTLLHYPSSMNGLSGLGYGLINSSIVLENYI